MIRLLEPFGWPELALVGAIAASIWAAIERRRLRRSIVTLGKKMDARFKKDSQT
jgi:GAF domain-containing protein